MADYITCIVNDKDGEAMAVRIDADKLDLEDHDAMVIEEAFKKSHITDDDHKCLMDLLADLNKVEIDDHLVDGNLHEWLHCWSHAMRIKIDAMHRV